MVLMVAGLFTHKVLLYSGKDLREENTWSLPLGPNGAEEGGSGEEDTPTKHHTAG